MQLKMFGAFAICCLIATLLFDAQERVVLGQQAPICDDTCRYRKISSWTMNAQNGGYEYKDVTCVMCGKHPEAIGCKAAFPGEGEVGLCIRLADAGYEVEWRTRRAGIICNVEGWPWMHGEAQFWNAIRDPLVGPWQKEKQGFCPTQIIRIYAGSAPFEP